MTSPKIWIFQAMLMLSLPSSFAQIDSVEQGRGAQALVGINSHITSTDENPSIRFTAPGDGDLVYGPRTLVSVSLRNVNPSEIVLEVSQDNEHFTGLDMDGPDSGPSDAISSLDTTAFRPGALYLRARTETAKTGPTVRVVVRRQPVVDCIMRPGERAREILIDCSKSFPQDGKITSFKWMLGDGTTVSTTTSSLRHTFPRYSSYLIDVTAMDVFGVPGSWLKKLYLLEDGPQAKAPDSCGCKQMTVETKQTADMTDPRRSNPTPPPKHPKLQRGEDPDYLTFNFEIAAELLEGSDPKLCTEGQLAKRTSQTEGLPAQDKGVCTAGFTKRTTACDRNQDCSTRTCKGGLANGKACDEPEDRQVCDLGGGACQANNDGKCTFFPYSGKELGEDDYRSDWPGDSGPKLHCSGCGSIHWIDLPGSRSGRRANEKSNLTYDSEFVSFVKGPGGSCSCHYSVSFAWDGTKQQYSKKPTLQPIKDGDTTNCKFN